MTSRHIISATFMETISLTEQNGLINWECKNVGFYRSKRKIGPGGVARSRKTSGNIYPVAQKIVFDYLYEKFNKICEKLKAVCYEVANKVQKKFLTIWKHRMKCIFLAGGLGTHISEESVFKPKPMIESGEMSILWYTMKGYSAYEINEFIFRLPLLNPYSR